MNSLVRLNEKDFLDAVVDTRFDLEITDITDEKAVLCRLNRLYGEQERTVTDGRIFVPGERSVYKKKYSVGDLAAVMDILTGENGCPWDRVQTHESIRINAVEEAYELVEAINAGDLDNMEEETGDLLLQAVFHANIAERAGEFDYIDVITRLCDKLVSRHTHIFGENKASNPEEALKSWEEAKAKEKSEETLEDKLRRIPKNYPAALMVQKSLKKLFKGGLVNDAQKATREDLIKAMAGAIAAGVDIEVDLLEEIKNVEKAYLDGKITKISEYK